MWRSMNITFFTREDIVTSNRPMKLWESDQEIAYCSSAQESTTVHHSLFLTERFQKQIHSKGL